MSVSERRPNTSSGVTFLRSRGIPIETVLDVGVQHGSPELCKSCPDLLHLLFEPVAEFQKSIAWNYRDIAHEVVASAVSDRDGETEIEIGTVIPGDDISHSRIIDTPNASGATHRRVPLITLDAFLSKRPDLKSPYLLKIDIDGLELRVLAGAKQTLNNCSAVIIEMHIGTDFNERFDALRSSGFELVDIVDLAYYRGRLAQVDGIFVRNDYMSLLRWDQPFDFSYWQTFS
jgi:FkbM family methyltransferase